ncbi:MAG: hypothetical protein FJ086_04840 [Deltaproteobacteria bacterium]|nr:hypothetical protein [Deltaproteobacteria bacterium]
MTIQTNLLETHHSRVKHYWNFKVRHHGWTVYVIVHKTKAPVVPGFNGFLVLLYTGLDEHGVRMGLMSMDVVLRRGARYVRRALRIRIENAGAVERCVMEGTKERDAAGFPLTPAPHTLLN